MARFITLDKCVRSLLIEKELPIHFYYQYLKLAADCYRELHFDVLGVTRSKEVSVGEDGSIIVPCDFVDYVGVWANKCAQKNGCGQLLIQDIDRSCGIIYLQPQSRKCAVDGRGKSVLEYITDGSECDAASKVHPYAQKTIEDYITWKSSPNRGNEYSPEGMLYKNSWKRLRGRIDPLTKEDLQSIMRKRTHIQTRGLNYLEAQQILEGNA